MKKHFISIIYFMCALIVVAAVAKKLDGDIKKHEEQMKNLNTEVAKAYKDGHYKQGISLAEKAYHYGVKHLGKEHIDTIKSISNLAELYKSQGRFREAEPRFKEALQMGKKVLGKEHYTIPSFINNLAGFYDSQGRYGEAEPLYKEAFHLCEKVLGQKHPHTLRSLNNLAVLYSRQGRYEKAEPLFKEALQVKEEVLGKEHPDTMTSINSLAELYRSQGRYREAEPLYKKIFHLREKVLGKEHPNTLTSLNNLAVLYYSQIRYGEAESLFKEALQLREKVLGKEHPDTLTSLNNLAELYRNQGRFIEAEPLHKEVLQLREKVLDQKHPDTLGTRLNYIVLMVNMETPQPAFSQMKNMENLLFSRSFQELYNTSEERTRRLYLQSISKFQDVVFLSALKYPESEYQQYAANVMLRWKTVYGEEYSYQYRLLNLNDDSEIKQLRETLTKLRSDFSRQIYHPKPDVNSSALWSEINATERIIREKAKASKLSLYVSDADISQVISHLPKDSALIEFRTYFPRDLKIGKKTKSHLAAYLLLPDAKQQLFFEDIGEAEDILSAFNSKESQNILYQKLFSKFDKHIKDLKKIYIAPDGFLHLVPFHTLRLPNGKYWTERQQINILQTGRDLLSPP